MDSFFFIGATLVSYLLLKDLDKTNGWGNMKGFIHMVCLYVNRYLRISIPYALYILYVAGIQHLLFKEPMNAGLTTELLARGCQQHWTANLLYVNNFVSEGMVPRHRHAVLCLYSADCLPSLVVQVQLPLQSGCLRLVVHVHGTSSCLVLPMFV